MKELLITIILVAVIFFIAASIKTLSNNQALKDTAEVIRDIVGVIYCMLIFWFFYCVTC